MQRSRPSGTATSAVPSRGTSVHPSKRAARAGYSAVKSGDDVKIALSTSSGRKPLPSWRARNSSAVAFRIALRLMVLTDAALLKGRDVVAECRQAARGGATMIQVRLKDAPPRDVAALTRSLVGALAIPVIVNDRVDVALAAGTAGAHLGQDDLPLDRVRPHVPPPPTFLLGISVGTPAEAERVRAWEGGPDYWSVGPCFSNRSEEHTSELQSRN